MKIKVKYFASLREITGVAEEVIDTRATTALALYEKLKEKYIFQFDHTNLKVALNEEYVQFSEVLSEMDTIVFIPPVAGG